MRIMASSPITSWQIAGEKVETVTGFIFLDSKITIDGDCSHKIKTLAEAVLGWQRNRMGRPLSPSQIHQKNISTLTKVHKTTSEFWQRTSGNQKSNHCLQKQVGKNIKEEKRDKGDGEGAPSWEGNPVPGRES